MIRKNGIEVFATHAVICCPAEHIVDARHIASEYMRGLNVTDWQPEKMLPIALSPSGEQPATHFACHMDCHDDDVRNMAAWIAGAEFWCANGVRSLDEDLLTEFLVCETTLAEFLRASKLRLKHPH